MLINLVDSSFWELIKAIKYGILLVKSLQRTLFKKISPMFTGDLVILTNYLKNKKELSSITKNKSERDTKKWMTEELMRLNTRKKLLGIFKKRPSWTSLNQKETGSNNSVALDKKPWALEKKMFGQINILSHKESSRFNDCKLLYTFI
jgi:hypothetical protein